MSDPYIGEIRMFAGSFAPLNWMLCQGQLVSISDYDTLFGLTSTTYGGDGINTFALPNLASRVPVHVGSALGNTYALGQTGGSENATVNTHQLPPHSHSVATAGSPGTTNTPAGNTVLSDQGPSGITPPIYGPFVSDSTVGLNPQSILPSSNSGQPHANIQPYLAINFIICMYGEYPPRS